MKQQQEKGNRQLKAEADRKLKAEEQKSHRRCRAKATENAKLENRSMKSGKWPQAEEAETKAKAESQADADAKSRSLRPKQMLKLKRMLSESRMLKRSAEQEMADALAAEQAALSQTMNKQMSDGWHQAMIKSTIQRNLVVDESA